MLALHILLQAYSKSNDTHYSSDRQSVNIGQWKDSQPENRHDWNPRLPRDEHPCIVAQIIVIAIVTGF